MIADSRLKPAGFIDGFNTSIRLTVDCLSERADRRFSQKLPAASPSQITRRHDSRLAF